MKWTELPEKVLLKRVFLFGLTGTILGAISLINQNFNVFDGPMGPLNGVSIGLQLVALSTAVLLLRKRKISESTKTRTQKLIIVLSAGVLFFMISL